MKARIVPIVIDGVEYWPCACCKESKPRAAFFGAKTRGSYCRDCQKAAVATCRRRNPIVTRRIGLKEEREDRYLAAVEDLRTFAKASERHFTDCMAEAIARYLAPREVN